MQLLLLQCDWEGALKVMDQAINDMPRTDHRQLVFPLSYRQTSLTFGLFIFDSCMHTLEVSAS